MLSVLSCFASMRYDLGRHIWDIPIDRYEYIAEITWLAEFAFLFCGGCTKISVLLFYRRLVNGSYDKRWKWAVIAAIVFTACWSVAFMLCLVFNCNPTEAYWKAFSTSWHRSYTCVDTTSINLLAGLFAIFSDIYAVLLPLLMTRRMGLPGGQKVALNIIFSLGLVVVGASAVRTHYLWEVGHEPDVSWLIFYVFVWAQLELQLGIMCAAAPAMRVFFRSYLSKPLNRAVHNATGSIASRHNEGGNPGRSKGSISRIVEAQEDHDRRGDDFVLKHSTKGSEMSTVSEVNDLEQGHSPSTSTRYLIKTPADYEAYNLQSLEQSRKSLEKRSRHAPNFSQQFVWQDTDH